MLRVEAQTSLGALDLEVALEVETGACLALAGPSGAGKTSVLRIAAGLVRPQHGRVEANGETWLDTERGVDVAPEHRRCGYLFQEYALFPHLSAWQNVAYPLRGMSRSARRERAHELLERFGLEGLADARPRTLSGGERQRVSIARAILHNPKILILDEATSSVDVETEKQMQEAIGRLTAGRTTFAIAHRLATLRNATRLIVLDNGEIVEVGTHAELMEKKGVFYDLVQTQSKINEILGENIVGG